MPIAPERIRSLNNIPPNATGQYVLYWAQMNRRVASNHALAHALDIANEMRLPVLYYEGLTCSYPYANDRLHTFILEGVPDTASSLKKLGIGYCFYLRRKKSDPNDILYKLASKAAAVVTDDYPTFIAAGHNASVPSKIDRHYIAVDSSCVVPMNLLAKREWAAYTIRPKITKLLPKYLEPVEIAKPKHTLLGQPCPMHVEVTKKNIPALVASCDIDHSVTPSTCFTGGSAASQRRLHDFLENKLRRYARERNEPSKHATSELSPYLHFGHISAADIALQARDYAERHGAIADEFLEELIVRRELAFNFVRHTPNYTSLDCLPEWALTTLREHKRDKRDPHFTLEQMESGETYDELWNATQRELLIRGKIHGYYRMYWGKKIIEWSKTHEEALANMIYLHDRYALDGRDPNTYTNILWCFGLHDRPWQERPIFGKTRYMSFEGMKRKTDINAYMDEIASIARGKRDPLQV